MEYQEAKKLKESWGDKPCEHPKIVREFYGDTFTLDFVCVQCGKEFNLLEMLEVECLKRKTGKQRSSFAI